MSKTARFLFSLFALLIPLFFLPITTNFFDFNKQYLLYLFASLSLLTWTLDSLKNRQIRLSLTPSTYPLLLLGLVFILSSLIQSPTPTTSLLGTTATTLSFVILFLTTTSLIKKDQVAPLIKTTVYTLITSLSLVALVALFSYSGLGEKTGLIWLQNKTFNPIGGPLQFLSFAAALLPALIYLTFKTKKNLPRLSLLFVTALTLAATITSVSLIWPSSNNSFRLLLLPYSAGWSIAVDNFKHLDTALLGTGPNTFLSTFSRLRPASLNASSLWNVRFSVSSGEFLTLLTTTGLLGALLWLTSLLKPILATVKTSSTSSLTRFSSLLLITSLIILLFIPANLTLLATTFIGLTLTNLSLKKTQAEKELSLDLSRQKLLTSIVFNLPFLGLLGYFWFLVTPLYAANYFTAQALATVNTDISQSYNYQIKAIKFDPQNPNYRINFSQTSLALASSMSSRSDLSDQDKANISQLVQQAVRESKTATQINPNNVIAWENLASTYRQLINFAQGADQWTIASYLQAISLDPTNPKTRLDLGGLFLSLNDPQEAIRHFTKAVELKPDWPNAHYNLSAAYKATKNHQKALEQMRIVVAQVDPNSADYQVAQNELQELEKIVASQTPSQSAKPTTETDQNLELVIPTPIPTTNQTIDLPADAAPEIPTPTPETSPTPSPTGL